uniref:Peptidase C1A papain C-terminal domain-containing protein n=1 Tax=Setaria viridis TaxID=4556 RepID=A0A4U6TFD1_SETVI|nr:hypothetical protein SEVIR_8G146800v2 [Setaria viridis]
MRLMDSVLASSCIDWRMMAVVTAAKNQGACGSCWAFTSVATMESAQAIRTRTVPPLLSEQLLVDCDGYDLGCRGGFLGNAFRWVIQIGGITWAPLYPYIGMSGMCQRFKPAAVRLRSYRWVVPNEVSLMQAVAQQPVEHYYGGVYDGRCFWNGVYIGGACGTAPSHAIAIVGYGTKPGGTKYWIGKNSWSGSWGDKGFVYLLRDSARVGVCGVAQQARYPII